MTKEELLEKPFDSACDAMYALNKFLREIEKYSTTESVKDYQHLRVIGNRIYE